MSAPQLPPSQPTLVKNLQEYVNNKGPGFVAGALSLIATCAAVQHGRAYTKMSSFTGGATNNEITALVGGVVAFANLVFNPLLNKLDALCKNKLYMSNETVRFTVSHLIAGLCAGGATFFALQKSLNFNGFKAPAFNTSPKNFVTGFAAITLVAGLVSAVSKWMTRGSELMNKKQVEDLTGNELVVALSKTNDLDETGINDLIELLGKICLGSFESSEEAGNSEQYIRIASALSKLIHLKMLEKEVELEKKGLNHDDFARLNAELSSISSSLSALQGYEKQIRLLQTEINDLRENITESENLSNQRDIRINELHNLNNQYSNQLDNLRNQITSLTNEKEQLQDNLKRDIIKVTNDKEALQGELRATHASLNDTMVAKTAVESKLTLANQEVQRLAPFEVQKNNLEAELAVAQGNVSRLTDAVSHLENKIIPDLETRLTDAQAEIKKLNEKDINSLNSDKANLEAKVSSLEAELNSANADLIETKGKLSTAEIAKEELAIELKEAILKKDEAEAESSTLKGDSIPSLKALIKDYESKVKALQTEVSAALNNTTSTKSEPQSVGDKEEEIVIASGEIKLTSIPIEANSGTDVSNSTTTQATASSITPEENND
jgi:predicted  nucleic acid-binding Zn-ribbon protein